MHPVDRIVTVWRMGKEGRYGRSEIYSAQDRVEAGVVEGLVIDLGEVLISD